MKLPACLLVVGCLSLGCVVGPEEVAAEKEAKSAANVEAAAKEEEIVQAASEAPATETAASEGFTKTNSGLKYKILSSGSDKRPKKTSTVTCHYRGWLDNGKEFDSSYKNGSPIDFPLNGVIAGWTEGLQLIGEGGKIELEIPSQLGYGAAGMPGAIPPNARLHFTVELIKVH